MKKIAVFVVAAMLAFAPLAYAASAFGPMGPAPNASDGVPDGSGFDTPNGPNSGSQGSGNGTMAPPDDAGDCIPNGDCDDCPNFLKGL
jgi:hypothetical protein